MRDYLLLYLLSFLLSTSLVSQVENGCITIDFESLPNNETLFEGLPISNQFENAFGLTFELDSIGVPVLADVGGSPPVAFGSNWGNDTPAPGVDMGRFFLTDDGILSGTESPAIILRFRDPIDTFAGCIVDMDFSEQFVLQALGENDEVLISDTIRAGNIFTGEEGDPGTGDGLLTCWGFNLPGCDGKIYSIRFEGTRPASAGGAFGMGLDHLSFCYSDIKYHEEIEHISCSSLGTYSIATSGSKEYEYSLDGTNYFELGYFDGLDAGRYEVYIRDNDGCLTSLPFTIIEPQPSVLGIQYVPTSCREDNGSISISINPNYGAQFSINDGVSYSDFGTFTDLAPRDYLIRVQDTLDCYYFDKVTIDPSVEPEIDNLWSREETCDDSNGQITIEASSGNGAILYSIDGLNFVSDNIVDNLEAGIYTIYVKDEMDCLVSETIEVREAPIPLILDVDVTSPDCFLNNGVIEVRVEGGLGELSVSLDSLTFQNSTTFESLTLGNYMLQLRDESGCTVSEFVVIESPLCPIYIPNVITPNGDDQQQRLFKAFTHSDYGVGILDYRIYDRWGELIFYSGQFSIHTQEKQYWWDGYFNGKPAEPGVYAYLIEVRHPNDTVEAFAGDLTVLK